MMHQLPVKDQSQQQQQKDLLRFTTAGSVDDGKSTLIGRLLQDTHGAFEDQIQAAIKHNESKGRIGIDLALLTDGLRAEREQGITIDVAYRYFATDRRKFIIADTPGHEQYTRNMVTGASTADAAVILIDARQGLLPQSRRHTIISLLLGIQHIIVAVNKMDLVDYAETVFQEIQEEFQQLFRHKHKFQQIHFHFIPVSALMGDMIVSRSQHMPWYAGPTLLEQLEQIPARQNDSSFPLRFAVQRVSRPQTADYPDFRGYMGTVIAGTVAVGDAVSILPGKQQANIIRIVTMDADLSLAEAGDAVNLVLDRDIDISRGNLLVHSHQPKADKADIRGKDKAGNARIMAPVKAFRANLCWMSEESLTEGDTVLIQHTTNIVKAIVQKIAGVVDLHDMQHHIESKVLRLNDIGLVDMVLQQPVMPDRYESNRNMGSFIVIDNFSNSTVGAGMICDF